jgi:hypothetical protein
MVHKNRALVMSEDKFHKDQQEDDDRRAPQVLVFGNVVQDLVSYVDRPPRPGELAVFARDFK